VYLSPIDVAVPTHTLTLNDEGWPTPNPLTVTVTVNNVTTETIEDGAVLFTLNSTDDLARFYVLEENGHGEGMYGGLDQYFEDYYAGEAPLVLAPGETLSTTWRVWVQPSEATTLTISAQLVDLLAGPLGEDAEEVSVPLAQIHPVVFVHGILGSMPPKNKIVDEWPQHFESAQLDPWIDSYSPLIENLMHMGYELDETLFPVLYDWRQSNRDSGAWLGETLAETVMPGSQAVPYVVSDGKADVVVHSMGGLVTRAYVQGLATDRPYQGDVNKVVFIATPHRGFPVTYRTWEGLTWEEYLGREVDWQADLVLPFQFFNYWSLRQLMDELLWPYFILKQYDPDAGQPCWWMTIRGFGLLGMLNLHYDTCYPCRPDILQAYSHSTDPDHPGIGSLPEMLPPVSDGEYPEAASRSIPPYLYDSGGDYPYGYQVNPLLEERGLNAPGVQTTLDAAIGLDNLYVIYGTDVPLATALRYQVEPPGSAGVPLWPDPPLPWPNGAVPSADARTDFTDEGDDLIPSYSTRLWDDEQGLLPDMPEDHEIEIPRAEHKGIVYHEDAQRAVGGILTGVGDKDSFPFSTPYNPANFFFNNADVIVAILGWSPVDQMVTDPLGRRIGYDPVAGEVVNEIPGAYYSGNAGEEEFFLLPGGLEGEYTITTVGTGSGDYLVTMHRVDTSGVRWTGAITGTASVGEVVTHTLAYTVPTTPFFFDDMESGPGNWSAEAGWSLTTGTAHSPVTAWGSGVVTPGQPLTLTLQAGLDLSTARMARLTFWHTYTLSSEAQARVELSLDGGATWGTLSARNSANSWMPVEIDLTPFTGPDYPPLRLRFRLLPTRAGDRWQIDDVGVEILEAPSLFALPFEDDVEGWRRWDVAGDWAVVTGTVHSGQRSWAADQDGSTLTLADSLDLREAVSPMLTLWYTMTANGTGNIEVSTDGTNWQPAATVTETAYWTQAGVDLSGWAGLTPTLRLRHTGQAGATWAVDDFVVRNVVPPVVHTLPFSDDMETPGNWRPFGGWETVTETAHSGTTAWRGDASDSALVLVDRLDLTGAVSPTLTFWHQFALPEGSVGHVEATTDDGLTWQPVLTVTDPISDWTQIGVDLSAYAGQEIGLNFYLKEAVTGGTAGGARAVASSGRGTYLPTGQQRGNERPGMHGVTALLPLALGTLACGVVLVTGRRERRRAAVLLAVLGASGALLACGYMSDATRYRRINELTDVLGEVELVVGAERQPRGAELSPDGRWMVVHYQGDIPGTLIDLEHNTEQVLPLGSIAGKAVRWLKDDLFIIYYASSPRLVRLPEVEVVRLERHDTLEVLDGADLLYALPSFGGGGLLSSRLTRGILMRFSQAGGH
ncbi:MAG: hypothetical protein ACE5OS_14930, partial [Anaerolineae bacterium]